MLGWMGSLFGVLGAILNAKRMRVGFVFYTIANVILIYVGASREEWYNVTLFSVFLGVAAYGWWEWGRKKP